MIEDKYIGLILAIFSTLGIGASFVITKKGLNEAAQKHGFEGDGFAYFRNPVWWGGMVTMVVGEVCNFSAYAFAPAILVTPLGALSVLIGAVLGSYFLDEKLGILGRVGCATCLIGSVVIVLHAPPDREMRNVGQLLFFALRPGFLFYCIIVTVFAIVMIYRVAPRYGKSNPMVYISICSTVGSISIMAIKGFGIALKLTLGGRNQFGNPSTYVFAIVVVVCILTQMNYFNKALSQFSTNIVNPLYYVTFTTCTLCASFILFRGFNTTDAINTISLLCGFLTIFTGVYLLNLSREDPDGNNLGIASDRGKYHEVDGIPVDGIGAIQTRMSMQSRRSNEDVDRRRSSSWSLRSPISPRHGRQHSGHGGGGGGGGGGGEQDQHLMHSYDVEANGLSELAEDSEEEEDHSGKRTSFEDNANGNKTGSRGATVNGETTTNSSHGQPRRAQTRTSETELVQLSAGHKAFDSTRR